jgi:hypothetical protein
LRTASEIRRVGRCYFVQTPNHAFPIDWRTMVPMFHFLPAAAQTWCFERARVGTYRRARDRIEALHWASRVRNIRRRELALLFPGGTVVHERFGGFTKSFIAHNLGPVPPNQPAYLTTRLVGGARATGGGGADAEDDPPSKAPMLGTEPTALPSKSTVKPRLTPLPISGEPAAGR